MTSSDAPTPRIASLDQFRGYTVAGMFAVNFLASFAACPRLLKHTNDYCSYADTIMPQFLFAVGFAFRLTFERRVQREGAAAAYSRVARRLLGLALLAFVLYVSTPVVRNWAEFTTKPMQDWLVPILKRDWFQTLMHIAVTSLWILPVIRASGRARVLFAVGSGLLHVVLSAWFNFEWVHTRPTGIDGGPLGFLTWTLPAIAGTFACDYVQTLSRSQATWRLVVVSVLLMLAGWGLSCGTRLYDVSNHGQPAALPRASLAKSPVIPPSSAWAGRPPGFLVAEPPFVPPPPPAARRWNYWMMSQRAGTLSYLTFTAGFSMAVYSLFFVVCDRAGWTSSILRTFGVNALAGYVLHGLIDQSLSAFTPKDSPAWWMWTTVALFLFLCWLFLRSLEKAGVYIRL